MPDPKGQRPERWFFLRLSFRSSLSLLCAVLICIACALVWYLGQRAGADLVAQLSARQRASTLDQVASTVLFELFKPVRAVSILSSMLQDRFSEPSVGVPFAGWLGNSTGFLADADFLLRTFAHGYQQLLGFGTADGFYAHVFSDFFADNQAADASDNWEYCWVRSDAPELEFRNITFSSVDPLRPAQNLLPQIRHGDAYGMETALGPPSRTLANYHPQSRPWFTEGVALNGSIGWSQPYNLLGDRSGVTVIATVQGILDATGGVAAVAYSVSYLSHITALLQTQLGSIGARGTAVVFNEHGVLLAASDRRYDIDLGMVVLSQSNDTTLRTIGDVVPPMSSDQLAAWGGVSDERVVLSGASYHLSAARISVPGLPLAVAVLTYDGDWTSDLVASTRSTALVSAGILLLSVAVMVGVTFWMARPLRVLTQHMTQFGSICAITADPHSEVDPADPRTGKLSTLEQVEALYTRWRAAIDPVLHAPRVAHAARRTSAVEDLPATPMQVVLASESMDRSDTCAFRAAREVGDLCRSFDVMLRQWRAMYDVLEHQKESKRQFIRYVFHEVRVPLNAIVLAVDHLDNSAIPPDVQDLVGILQEQSTSSHWFCDNSRSLIVIDSRVDNVLY